MMADFYPVRNGPKGLTLFTLNRRATNTASHFLVTDMETEAQSVPSSILPSRLSAFFILEPHPDLVSQGPGEGQSFRPACHCLLPLRVPWYPWNLGDPLDIHCLSPGYLPRSTGCGGEQHPTLSWECRAGCLNRWHMMSFPKFPPDHQHHLGHC